MIIQVCDPAKKVKERGFAEINEGVLTWWQVAPFAQTFQNHGACEAGWGVVEAQWANPKASRQSLISLAAHAGFCFRFVPARRYAMIPPTKFALTVDECKRLKLPKGTKLPGWKDVLIPGFGSADGDVFTRNIKQLLGRMKHPAAAEENHNVLDACGIALAAWKLFQAGQLEKYEIL